MAFHPDGATCRRIPLKFLTKRLTASTDREDVEGERDAPDESRALIGPPPLPSHWVDMLDGDVSLDTLFC